MEGANKSVFVDIGDFILSNSMSVGRPYILKIKGCIHDGWLVFKNIKDDLIDRNYLYYILKSNKLNSIINNKANGAIVKNLKIEIVENLKIQIPPLDKQQKIIKQIEKIENEINILENEIKSLDKEKENILNKYLNKK